MSNIFQRVASDINTQSAADLEAYIVSFFGSMEEYEKVKQWFILEVEQGEMEFLPNGDGMSYRMSIANTYRIRLKTEYELREEDAANEMGRS